jgi:hypothetical protein
MDSSLGIVCNGGKRRASAQNREKSAHSLHPGDTARGSAGELDRVAYFGSRNVFLL